MKVALFTAYLSVTIFAGDMNWSTIDTDNPQGDANPDARCPDAGWAGPDRFQGLT